MHLLYKHCRKVCHKEIQISVLQQWWENCLTTEAAGEQVDSRWWQETAQSQERLAKQLPHHTDIGPSSQQLRHFILYKIRHLDVDCAMSLSMQEAKKKDEKLLKFPEKLQDVQSAAR